jgi:hypothetical protein
MKGRLPTLVIIAADGLNFAIDNGSALEGRSWLPDDGRHGYDWRRQLIAIEWSLRMRVEREVGAKCLLINSLWHMKQNASSGRGAKKVLLVTKGSNDVTQR